jgi:hypothetical protein
LVRAVTLSLVFHWEELSPCPWPFLQQGFGSDDYRTLEVCECSDHHRCCGWRDNSHDSS